MSAALPAAGLRLVKTNEDVEVHVYNVAPPSESEEKKELCVYVKGQYYFNDNFSFHEQYRTVSS